VWPDPCRITLYKKFFQRKYGLGNQASLSKYMEWPQNYAFPAHIFSKRTIVKFSPAVFLSPSPKKTSVADLDLPVSNYLNLDTTFFFTELVVDFIRL